MEPLNGCGQHVCENAHWTVSPPMNCRLMTEETPTETVVQTPERWKMIDVNWTRVEGVIGVGALLTSFIWFLGMPTGMAIGVGFGIVLVLDVVRALIFGSSRPSPSEPSTTEFTQH